MADAIEILTAKVDALAKAMSEGFAAVAKRFDQVDQRFDGVDQRFDGVEAHFTELREYIDLGYKQLKAEIGRVDRKLDQFIDRQLRG
jgi:hypothetical protein